MNKVIDLLKKELERQEILHQVNKSEEKKKADFGDGYKGPSTFPNSHLFEDEIKKAIEILKNEGQ